MTEADTQEVQAILRRVKAVRQSTRDAVLRARLGDVEALLRIAQLESQ